ncbi:MAG: type II and III secretion system protein [Bryobacterales bacterium]|nr:type II and III secretion system protein [Bryobacterales bacterium]
MNRLVAAILLSSLPAWPQQSPSFYANEAKRAEKSGDFVRAYLLYAQAASTNPKNLRYWLRSQALQSRALATNPLIPPVGPPPPSAELVETDPPTPEDLTEARQAQPPLRLRGQDGLRDLKVRGDSKAVAEQVLKAYGIEVVFDADYQALPNLRFELNQATFPEAAAALQASTASFLVPVSERMALVARDTAQKRQELEHTMAVSIPLPHPFTLQEVQELARAVQQLFEIQKFGIDSQRRIAVVRDRASKVIPAVALFRQLLRHRAEVMIEVDFMEVNRNKSRELGIQWQTDTLFAWLGSAKSLIRSPITTFTNFATFGGGASLFGIGISSTQMLATMSERDGQTLYSAQMRSSEGNAVNFHLGDKYPVMTVGYFGTTSGTGQTYTPPPTFNFEDLGVVLKITPRVLENAIVAMEVEAEYKVLTGEALNGIPVIANRKFNSTVRLKQGEAAIVAGLMRVNEARTLTGIAGLANIPALGALFRQQQTSTDTNEALLVIRPRLLDLPPHEFATGQLYTGTETKPRIPL